MRTRVPGSGGERRRVVARLCPVLMVRVQAGPSHERLWLADPEREEGPGGAQELFLPVALT